MNKMEGVGYGLVSDDVIISTAQDVRSLTVFLSLVIPIS